MAGGVAATQFPQGTGLAATWNTSAAFEMGRIASEESRGMMQYNWPNGTSKRVAADYRTLLNESMNIYICIKLYKK